MVEKVKVFFDETSSVLERKVNEWLTECGEKITIVDRQFRVALAKNQYGSTFAYSVLIFYTDKH